MSRLLQPITLEDWIKKARKSTLSKNPTAPEEIIFKVLGLKPEELLQVAPKIKLSSKKQLKLNNHLGMLLVGRPLAAVVRSTEFYNTKLKVNSKVLAPRAESEVLAEFSISNIPKNSKVIEVGIGSGAIALSIAKARPDLSLTVSDVSSTALRLAKQNRNLNKVPRKQISFVKGSLLRPFSSKDLECSYIVANLPYLNPRWEGLKKKNLSFEPYSALYSENDGLQTIINLLQQVRIKQVLNAKNWVLLEHDPRQTKQLNQKSQELGFKTTFISPYCTQIKLK
jgi:release factor glutamine methyltransferase